jgi:predicted phosphodiesterase
VPSFAIATVIILARAIRREAAANVGGSGCEDGPVRTVVVSDLHLGAANDADLLRRPSFLKRLTRFLGAGDRVVLLGDVLELRDRPLRRVVELSTPAFEAIGRAVGAGGEVVVVAGNHDHHLVEGWLERRMLDGAGPLGLEQFAEPEGAAAPLAAAAAPAPVRLAYPGLWLADRIYATHGHFLDRHLTIPTFERLGVAMVERLLGMPPADDPLAPPSGPEPVVPEVYESAQGPVYALLFALAQAAPPGRTGGAEPSARIWQTLGGGESAAAKLRGWLLGAVAVPGAVGVANRLGLGPVRSDLSPGAISRAGIAAMRDVVEKLRIDADWVVFGHTHRRGPREGESEWLTPAGARLVNTGSWVHSPGLLGRTAAESGWWPGTAGVVEDGEPRLVHLLDELSREDLNRPD